MQQAIVRHQSGQLQEAEQLYRAILQAQPNHPDANHNLGVLAVQVRQPAAALPHFKVALEANPNQAQYWLSYIDALIQTGQNDAARQALEQGRHLGLRGEAVEVLAVRLESGVQAAEQSSAESNPSLQEISTLIALYSEGRHAEAATLAQTMTMRYPLHGFGWKALGGLLGQMGRRADALAPLQKAAALSPSDAEVHINLGNTLLGLGRLDEAEASYRRALQIKPDYTDAHYNLGIALHDMGRLDEAEASYRQALQIKPDFAEAHHNLGDTLKDLGWLDEAETSYRRALQIKPDYAEAHSNLGNALLYMGRPDEAEASYRRALQIKPDFADTHSNLGNALLDLGRLDEAEASYRRALQIKPDFADAHDNLLFLLNYGSRNTPSYCLAEARLYGQRVSNKVTTRFVEWSCVKQPERLRVGFVSGDFRNHAVSYFLESLLTQIDPASIDLVAYPTYHMADELTARIKSHFAAWKPLLGHTDESAARLIHSDDIHVLIDLSGHTRYNRLPIFAWKPAPVQVSWLGYFATTGVAEIDYVLGDLYAAPPHEAGHFTEKLWRLPETRLCFTEPDVALEVAPLPALSTGNITFGCFNNLTKMNDAVVAVWAKILTAVPGSKLFLKTKQLNEALMREVTLQRFAKHGITADRLILEGAAPRAEYLASYHHVDIALDPFPFPGGTTSIEGLWMGVPVITKCGDRFLSRQGETIAHNAGLSDWVAVDEDDYVAKAVTYASDLDRLANLRVGLRQQVLASPLFDAARFARYFEEAMWGMWSRWLEQRGDS